MAATPSARPRVIKDGANPKTYRNTGVSTLEFRPDPLESESIEINPDETLVAELDPEFEAQMLSGGHLVVVD